MKLLGDQQIADWTPPTRFRFLQTSSETLAGVGIGPVGCDIAAHPLAKIQRFRKKPPGTGRRGCHRGDLHPLFAGNDLGDWMPAFRLRLSNFAAVSVIAIATWMQPGVSHAYTPEEQQACTPDAMRLCGDYVPDVDRITACMVQKKAQLSPQCAVFFHRGPAPGQASARRASRPMSIKPVSRKTGHSKRHKSKKTAKAGAS